MKALNNGYRKVFTYKGIDIYAIISEQDGANTSLRSKYIIDAKVFKGEKFFSIESAVGAIKEITERIGRC